ncbi:LOW QUALITY PROTEIN: uncharacterized protein C21orf62 homolog [Myotis lucifugus]|uniref:LOW QUALITY PROTEIN: uncharacterized protein C21orf62 homolog n=1 Tax=Myotis lucifugus TaxID=59463 RepID=UPI000CCC3D72|nr:LOW QUALITY PROTEIN: uncharacterized protein C21orf62 homolog [Myotis lucifugus]
MAPAPGHSLLLVVLGVLALGHLAGGQLSSTLILAQDNAVRSCRCPSDIRDYCDYSLASLLCAATTVRPLAPSGRLTVWFTCSAALGLLLNFTRDLRLSLCSEHTLPARSLALCGLELLRVTVPAQAWRPKAPHSLLLLREPREQPPERPAGPSRSDIALLDTGLFNRGSSLKAYSAGTFPSLSGFGASPSVSN